MQSSGKDPVLRSLSNNSVRKTVVREMTRHYRALIRCARGTRLGTDPEHLHDMRVSVRRLRAILRLFRGDLPTRLAAHLAGELKWLGQSLGAVRDLDVHLHECAARLRHLPKTTRLAAEPCRHEMSRRREHAQAALGRDLRSQRFNDLREDCSELIGRLGRPTATRNEPFTGAGRLRSELKKIVREGRAITRHTPEETLHKLRVRCKRLRYACETLSALYARPVGKMARRLGALQDVLGAHQDAVTARALIERALAEPAATGGHDPIIAAMRKRCAIRWREEQRGRRAAFPRAWRAFDRRKARRAFLKTIAQPTP